MMGYSYMQVPRDSDDAKDGAHPPPCDDTERLLVSMERDIHLLARFKVRADTRKAVWTILATGGAALLAWDLSRSGQHDHVWLSALYGTVIGCLMVKICATISELRERTVEWARRSPDEFQTAMGNVFCKADGHGDWQVKNALWKMLNEYWPEKQEPQVAPHPSEGE